LDTIMREISVVELGFRVIDSISSQFIKKLHSALTGKNINICVTSIHNILI
jgi:hypothetical protein